LDDECPLTWENAGVYIRVIPSREGTRKVEASHNLERVSIDFDDDTLLPNGGLTVVARLAQKLGLADLVDEHVTIAGEAGANSGAKALTIIAAALAGGDCIDDVRVLQAGATRRLFDGIRAASTVGIWLRAFIWATVRQLDRVTRELLARAWAAGLGPADLTADLTVDVDSTVVETYGLAKQGGTDFTYTKVRGYHPLLATLAETGEVLATRLRGGKANTARGAARFVAETISRVRHAGATGALTLRADSGFYVGAVVAACRRHNVRLSITARKNAAIQRAIDAIPDHAWIPIPYWLDGGADVAETVYTAFAGTTHETTARLIVRRVRPTPGSQLALDVVFSYHPIFTDRDGSLLELEADHRRHAVVEHPICDLKHHAGLAHLPSGVFTANAAWLALVVVAYNLAKWTANAAALGRVTTKTLRLTIIAAPARLITSGRRLRLRMPTSWPWADHITCALEIISKIEPAPG
jgi:hypothetical protein